MTKAITCYALDKDDLRAVFPHVEWITPLPETSVPAEWGIYAWLDDEDRLLYVGKVH
jgi:hypothetical protein